MTLAIWTPRYSKYKGCIRKHYDNETKWLEPWAATWSLKGGIKNGEANLERIERLVRSIKEKDQPFCLANAFPVSWADRERFERKFLYLEDKGTDILYLDFDKKDADVSLDTDLHTRVRLCLSKLPIQFEKVGLVAFYSSSAYWEKTKPTRVSIHVIVILDKVYPHKLIHRWQKQYKKILDPATAIRSQPLYVANPRFIDTTARTIQGEEIYLREGPTVALGKINYKKEDNHTDIPFMEAMTKDVEGWKEQSLKLAKEGKLDGRRGNFLFNTFQRKIFYERTKIGEYLQIIKDNPILYVDPKKNDRTWKDVLTIYEGALRYVNSRLLGKSIKERERFAVKEVNTKTLSIDDIKDFPTDKAITLVKSGCNTRKTTGIIDPYIKLGGFKTAIYVTTDRASIDCFVNNENVDAPFRGYQEGGAKPEAKQEWMPKQDWLATTEQSLRYYLIKDGTQFPNADPPELIIIDECEAVAMNILNPNSMRSAHVLYDMCERAKAVLMLDADITDGVTGFLAESLADQSGKETKVLLNRFDWNSEKRIYILKSEIQAYRQIAASLDAGENIYCHVGFSDGSEKKRITRMIKFFSAYLQDNNAVKGFDAKNVRKDLRINPNKVIQEWFSKGLRLLIHSPWSKRSWDYNPTQVNATQFDTNIGIYPHTFFSHVNINQQDWRMRRTRNSYIYITPEKNYTKLNYYEEKESEGYLNINESLKDQVFREAKKRRSDEQSNVKDAYIELVTRQGADVRYDFMDEPWLDEFGGELSRLLTEVAGHALDDEIKAVWDIPHKRDFILDRFYKESETISDEFNGTIERPPYKAGDYETFKELYIRYLRIKPEDVNNILTIWNMGVKERKVWELEEPAVLSVTKGMLLDCVDKALESYYPEGITKFPNMLNLDRDIFQICIDKKGRENIGKTIKFNFNMLDGEIPWLNASHKKNYLGYFEDCLKFFDVNYWMDKEIPKKEPKANIIKEYEKLGYVKKSLLIGEKINKINYTITEKIKKGEQLTYNEDQWQLARGTNYYIILDDLRSRVIYDGIELYGDDTFAIATEKISVLGIDIKNENKKFTEGLAV